VIRVAHEEEEMDKIRWLVFSYNLPAEPTRARVWIWRKLKRLGAVNARQSLWLLPHTEENRSNLQASCAYIEKNGGTSLLLEGTALDDRVQSLIMALFREA